MSLAVVLAPAAGSPARNGGVGLWVFMGVVSSLFALFLTAYVMRAAEPDWSVFELPWQLWLSSGLLLAGSVALHVSGSSARAGHWPDAKRWLITGGGCALSFLSSQSWAWQVLQAQQVVFINNPAASFFYLLTAIHGLHLAGGLVGWLVAAYQVWRGDDPARGAALIALCARYWHFMLFIWALLFGAMAWITPELARFICGRA